LNKMRSAAPQIGPPELTAARTTVLAPMPEQRGRPGPHPGGSKAVRRSAIIATVHTGAQHRQSNSKSFSLRMTGKMTGKCSTTGDSAKCFQQHT
jgi:hypothetical protein